MEIKGYHFNCLDIAMQTLGEACQYAVISCKLTLDEFFDFFISSGYSRMFETGSPKLIGGSSGIELVLDVLDKVNMHHTFSYDELDGRITPEYWCGWIMAYYQWKTGFKFRYIHSQLSMEEVMKLYPTLHEASEDKFVEVVNSIIKRKVKTTRLQALRKERNLSQAELARKSGVNLRTLQEYETGAKDINKMALIKAIALSKALGCEVDDLIELI